MSTIVLYHADCVDGFTAAWAVWNRPSAAPTAVQPVRYGEPIPDAVSGFDDVIIVDFCYPPDDLVKLSETHNVTVLDHHATALEQLGKWAGKPQQERLMVFEPFRAIIDVTRSGAGIAWDSFHGGTRPELVDYVEDRDLWKHELPNSRTVSAFVRTRKHSLKEWSKLMQTPISELVEAGRGCEAQLDKIVSTAVNTSYWCEMGGRKFPITNVVYAAASDTAEALIEHYGSDMAAYFVQEQTGQWKYGFRSAGQQTVHDFASQFGGGGHPTASGATLANLTHRRIPDDQWPTN